MSILENQPRVSALDPRPQLAKSRFGERLRQFYLRHSFLAALGIWTFALLSHRIVVWAVDGIALLDLTRSEMIFFLILLIGAVLFSVLFSQAIQRQNLRTDQAFDEIELRSHQLHSVGLLGLIRATAARDKTMSLHLRRVGLLSETLGRALAKTPKYSHYLTEQYLSDLSVAAALHDVGRIGIADSVLCKGGGLTADEFEMMKMHVIIGGDIIAEMQRTLPFRSYYSLAKDVTYHHHQRWDGTGYPNVLRQEGNPAGDSFFIQDGIGEPLKGEEIPLSARIVAVADVYDALVSRRRYREPITHDEACRMIAEKSGNHFDQDVVNAFMSVSDEMHRIVQEIRE